MALPYNRDEVARSYDNRAITIFSSAARTASVNSEDITNYGYVGIQLVIDITAVTSTPSVTFTIQGKDDVSGKYFDILASAAFSVPGTHVLRVHPSFADVPFNSAQDAIPRTWRVKAAHANANSITYSVSALPILR